MKEPSPKATYAAGRCTILTYHEGHHELHYDNHFVANFRTFRDAVRYQLMEFP